MVLELLELYTMMNLEINVIKGKFIINLYKKILK